MHVSAKRLSDEEYRFIFSRVPRLCVDLIIKKDNGFILTKRDIEPNRGTWHMPGGRLLHYESVAQAIERIAKQEVGVTVDVIKQIGYVEYLHDGEFAHSVSLAFLVSYKSGEIRRDYQANEIAIFSKLPHPMYPGQGEFIGTHLHEILP